MKSGFFRRFRKGALISCILLAVMVGALLLSKRGGRVDMEEMVLIPGGYFSMGCNEGVDDSCAEDEKPYLPVYLDPFYMDRHEVLVDDYRECVKRGVCRPPAMMDGCNYRDPDKGDHPVNCVSWDDAAEYCHFRGKRLPTEAEWEKGARGVDGRVFPWGNSAADGDKANFCDRNCPHPWRDEDCDDGYGLTSPAGRYPAGASPYGLLDMAGNLWEWVYDIYTSDHHMRGGERNPVVREGRGERVCRGGSYLVMEEGLRTSLRFRGGPQMRRPYLGFRCAYSGRR